MKSLFNYIIKYLAANMYYSNINSNKFNIKTESKNIPCQCNCLLQMLAEKDMYTYTHSQYTAQYAADLAKSLNLNDSIIKDLEIAGWFHDIGKVLVINNILRKNSKLNEIEYSNIQQHVVNGLNILVNCDISPTAISAIKFHHERWDGKGYPNGIYGKNTPIEGRILQIADAFSAMTVKRIYREPFPFEEAIKELKENSGKQFDPQLSKVFIDMLENKKIAI
ncbi:MAG: HD-GYP domain-containing protein [Sedimentibacter sp.]